MFFFSDTETNDRFIVITNCIVQRKYHNRHKSSTDYNEIRYQSSFVIRLLQIYYDFINDRLIAMAVAMSSDYN